MNLSLADAAKLAGVSKSALFKAMRRGVFTASRDDVSGEWRVNISELQRVYPLKDMSALTAESVGSESIPSVNESAILSERVRALEETLSEVKGERDDLRRRLDAESDERRRLTLMLTGPSTNAEKAATGQRVPWILYMIAVSTVTAAGVALYLVIRG